MPAIKKDLTWRRLGRVRGQATVLIALCMLLLVLMVALAVDGGSMLNQRREAQNAADGAALAGTRVMLQYYEQMIRDNPNGDVDYIHDPYELSIRNAIVVYAAANGILTETVQAYFVNDNSEIVTVANGLPRGGERCGTAQPRGPCQVGENGRVPWTLGAKGIMVKGTSQTSSYFMSIFGWNKVGASANATAFMGVGAIADNISLLPIGLFTATLDINNLREGQHYVLLDADINQGSGNWGWVDYNGYGTSRNVGRDWLLCGYNPSLTGEAQWRAWCSDRRTWGDPNYGPTQHFIPISDTARPDFYGPQPDPTFIYSIVYGERWNGWWLIGSSGSVNANCQDLQDRIDNPPPEGYSKVLFPIFDRVIPQGGQSSFYHIRVVVAFRLYPGDVGCRPVSPPTPTPCYIGTCPTPTPAPRGSGGNIHWRIEGDYDRIYSTASSGRHGNLRTNSVHTIFLDK